MEASRITKEDVLEKSVEYIEHLRSEIRSLKRRRGVGDPSTIIGIELFYSWLTPSRYISG